MTHTLEHDFETVRRLPIDEAICLPPEQLTALHEQALDNFYLCEQIIEWVNLIRHEKGLLADDEPEFWEE